MSTTADDLIRPPAKSGMLLWMRKNLFSSGFNTVLTVVTISFLFFMLRGLLRWAFLEADWSPVVENLRLYAVGTFPADQMWRVWVIIYLVSFLMGISGGRWRGTILAFSWAMVASFLVLALLPIKFDDLPISSRLLLIANLLFLYGGFQLGSRISIKPSWIIFCWGLAFCISIVLLGGFKNIAVLPSVESGQWGGLLLTFLLAIVGIVASFPIGVLLALGRQSSLPVVKGMCILFIEVVRGVPLVTILFMSSILLPLFLPDTMRIDRVLRAILGMTLFASAYMAENVRGGLQSIPRGQYDAAKAMGLNNLLTTVLIILPQALRVVIPAIVGQFIALFMDTTLATIVGLLELLAVGSAILNSNPKWLLLDMEVYSFIALIFWIFTFSMAYASRRLETAVGLGTR